VQIEALQLQAYLASNFKSRNIFALLVYCIVIFVEVNNIDFSLKLNALIFSLS